MRYADLHTHTHLSFDSEADLIENCRAAREAGLSAIAVTNHFDFDGILQGIYPSFLPHKDRAEIERAREAFPDLTILHGIEMGQAYAYAELIPLLRRAHGLDYLLASVHNLEGYPDFCFLRYEEMSTEHCVLLLRRYFADLARVAALPGITTLAHLTYPLRYMTRAGKRIDLLRFENEIRAVFHVLIENGVRLEVNTSGLRQGMNATMPDFSLVALYRDCGGRAVAVGSDAHLPMHVGAGVIEITDRLRQMGMELPF